MTDEEFNERFENFKKVAHLPLVNLITNRSKFYDKIIKNKDRIISVKRIKRSQKLTDSRS
jgi:hypothetical protein